MPGIAQGPDEPARERADVGTAVTADLGLVAHAAERDTDELAAGRTCDRLTDRGLAGAGRADQREDRAGALVLGDPALLAQLLDRDVFDDAVLDVIKAGVVGIQHRTRVLRVETLLGALAPRHGQEPIEIGADHAGLAGLLADALQATELLLGLLAHVLGHCGLFDLGAVLLDHRGVVLTELAADRLHLLAQEVIALLLLGAGLDVVTDALAHLQLGQALTLERERQLQALEDVDLLKQLDALLVVEVGGVAGCVGERAGLGDAAQERLDPAVGIAQLEDLLDDRAVLALELARVAARDDADRIGALIDVNIEAAVRLGDRCAGDTAVQALDRDGAGAAGQANSLGDGRDRADCGEFILMARHEQHALFIGGVDCQRDGHAGEDDRIIKRNK